MTDLDPGTVAHRAVVARLDALYERLEAEDNGEDVDWADTPAVAPFCGCTDCLVREVLSAGITSLVEQGALTVADTREGEQ